MASSTLKPYRINSRQPVPPNVLEAAGQALRRGELVIIPTETVYGLAADPRNALAMKRLFAAKRRPAEKDVTRMAADRRQVGEAGAVFGVRGEILARRFWPGPLTLVLPTPEGFMGFRIPGMVVTRELLAAYGSILAVTSANTSGEPPARTAEEAMAALGESVAVAIDAGPSPGGVPSTVVKIDGDKVEVLRTGAIPTSEILRVVREDASGS